MLRYQGIRSAHPSLRETSAPSHPLLWHSYRTGTRSTRFRGRPNRLQCLSSFFYLLLCCNYSKSSLFVAIFYGHNGSHFSWEFKNGLTHFNFAESRSLSPFYHLCDGVE